MFGRTKMLYLTLLLGPCVPMALAQHQQGGQHEQEHGKPAEFAMPTNYRQAVAEIQHRLHEIEELIDAKKLDQVHSEAEVVQKVGKIIGQLALKADSGVPKDAVKDVNKAGRDLAAKFDAIDKAGDSGDLAGTKKVYEEMVKLTATLQKHVAGGPHGGSLAWSADRKHQVEAALGKDNDVRVYVYDDTSKPISVSAVTAQAHGGKEGAEHKSISLTPDSSKSFFTGQFDAATKPPLVLMVSIDFKDGEKAQSFTFNLGAPMHSAREEHKSHKDEHKGHKP